MADLLLYAKNYPVIMLAAALVFYRLAYMIEDIADVIPAWRVVLALLEWGAWSIGLCSMLLFLYGVFL